METIGVDADVLEEHPAFERVGVRRLDRLRAAMADHRPVAVAELVPLGVAAEIVVIVEDQDLRVGPDRLPEEIRGGEAAHPAADDDEVVAFPGVLGCSPGLRVPQRVSDLERTRVAAAHSRSRRRVVVWSLSHGRLLKLAGGRPRRAAPPERRRL